MHLIATCPEETKDVLIRELEALGATNMVPGYRAVEFEADDATFYEAHLRLSTASRILRVLKDIPAKTPEMLYSQARRLPWPELFDVNYGYLIEGIAGDRGDGCMTGNDISKRIREALQDVFMKQLGKVPKVDLQEPKVVIVAFLRRGRCILSLDTTGKALHKRGYRADGHPAPIKETLAASILNLAGFDGSTAFLDPMCGSGTIAIEAAMRALHKAPSIHRKKGQFNFEWLKDFDRDLWRVTQDRVRLEKLEAPAHPIYASDVSDTFVKMARDNALRARVEKHIQFDVGRFQDVIPPAETGILVANLPYGERLNRADKDGDERLKTLYQEIGDTLKRRFAGWRAALLVAVDSPHKFIGLKPTRKVPLLNGSIECRLLIYDLYAGSRRVAKPSDEQAAYDEAMSFERLVEDAKHRRAPQPPDGLSGAPG